MANNNKPMSPFGAHLFRMAQDMNEALSQSRENRIPIKRTSKILGCKARHSWPDLGKCPFCNPEDRLLSEFGSTEAPRKTGAYDAETLLALERSHDELLTMAYYWAGRAMKLGEQNMLAKLNGMIHMGTRVRKKAGLE